eukprot:6090819-Ditylum_brightwellii.AAC.2
MLISLPRKVYSSANSVFLKLIPGIRLQKENQHKVGRMSLKYLDRERPEVHSNQDEYFTMHEC